MAAPVPDITSLNLTVQKGKRPSPSTHQQCPGLHWDSTSQVPSPPGPTPSQENTSHCLALPVGAALGTCCRRMGDGDWRLGAAGPLYGGSLSSRRPVSPGWGWRAAGNLQADLLHASHWLSRSGLLNLPGPMNHPPD